MAQEDEYGVFAEVAAELIHDIDDLIGDAKFVDRGGQIILAVDFSEIYAYCMSSPNSFIHRHMDSAVKKDDPELLKMLNESIMMYYMFEASKELWLLEPYQFELDNFMRVASSNQFAKAMYQAGAALLEGEELSKDPAAKELEEIAKAIGDDGQPTEEQARRLEAIFQQLAPRIASIKAGTLHYTPIEKTRQLLHSERVVAPSNLPRSVAEGDKRMSDLWLEALSEQRSDLGGRNQSDATAMGVIYATNAWLQEGKGKDPRRMVLLTRSDVMHRIMAAQMEKGLWKDVGGNPLRHPRGVLALLDEREGIVRDRPDRQIATLLRWQNTFRAFTDKSAPANLPGRLTSREIVKRHKAVIYNAWRRYCGLSALLGEVQAGFADRGDEARYVSILLNRSALKTHIRKRLDSLGAMFTKSDFVTTTMRSQELRTAAATAGPRKSKSGSKVRADTVNEAASQTMVHIRSGHDTPMPFRIGLTSKTLVELFQNEQGDPWRTLTALALSDVASAERRSPRDVEVEAEWYVSMAYVLAAVGAWARTLDACKIVQTNPKALVAEAALLELKAVRRVRPDRVSLEGALQELTSKAPRDGDYYIRFLGEKLSYEALLLKQASIDGASKAMTRHSKLLGGLLQQAETELQKRGTSYETCELLNKGAYYLNELDIAEVHFADFPKRFSSYPEIILRTYVAFVRQVKELYSEDWRMWPDGFVDTFAWVGLHLYLRAGRSSEFTHVTPEKILQIYEQIRKREFVSEADLLEFRRHGSEAERLLAAD